MMTDYQAYLKILIFTPIAADTEVFGNFFYFTPINYKLYHIIPYSFTSDIKQLKHNFKTWKTKNNHFGNKETFIQLLRGVVLLYCDVTFQFIEKHQF